MYPKGPKRMNIPQYTFNEEADEVFCAIKKQWRGLFGELRNCRNRKQPIAVEEGVVELNDKIILAHDALNREYKALAWMDRLTVSDQFSNPPGDQDSDSQCEFASASRAFEDIGKYMSVIEMDVESGLAGEKDDDARRLSENCFIMLRTFIRFLGNALNEALPEQKRLCLDWRFAFLELAAHLHLYAESCGMNAWSCDMEKREARKQLSKDLALCQNMAAKVAEVLRDYEQTQETIGRFLVFRDMRSNDIRMIWELTDFGAYTNIYKPFEHRATKILDTLFDAYRKASSSDDGNSAEATDGWCRAGKQWVQAFQKRKNGNGNSGANSFYNDNIEQGKYSQGKNLKNISCWRIKPDPTPKDNN